MRLKIEDWVNNNKFSENINLLLDDAVLCYKAGANRAALLFSYLGFLTILKERMIDATIPALFPLGQWNHILQNLRNEDAWEKAIFDATQTREKYDPNTKLKTKDAIFSINENLRLQICYWKDRRNDCAHFKNNTIEGYHVDSFWAFIQSNLPKITVEGGLQTLLNKIFDHFNPYLTPPDKDYTSLVKEIENSIDNSKLTEFWESLLHFGEYDFELGTSRKKIISKSMEKNNSKTNEPLLVILKSNKFLMNDFLSTYPDKIVYFNLDDKEIRKFWQTQIRNMSNPLPLYTAFLRNNLIPLAEIPEANKIVLSKLIKYEVEQHQHLELLNNNFYQAAKEQIFMASGFEQYLWVNDRADLIASIIKHYPADPEIVNRICYVYGLSKSSDWLLERFDKLFIPNTQITIDFKDLITNNGITVPVRLQKYFN